MKRNGKMKRSEYEVRVADKNFKQTVGISYVPRKDYTYVGSDAKGNKIYFDNKKLQNTDVRAGAHYTETFYRMMDKFGVVDEEGKSHLQATKKATLDKDLYRRLDSAAKKDNPKEFVELLVNKFGKKVVPYITDDKREQAGLNASFNAYNLYTNWNRMSPAQRTLGIANTGIQSYHAYSGTNLSRTKIPGSESRYTGQGVTVGQALGLINAGYNGYQVAKNWDQYDTMGRIIYGGGSVAQTAAAMQNAGLLSNTASTSAAAGTGVGANTASFTATGAGVNTTAAAGGEAAAAGGASTLGNVAGGAALAAGAYGIYQNWGNDSAKGRKQGALIGGSMAAGLAATSYWNPYVAAAFVAVGVLSGSVNVGKHEDQYKRDGVRSYFKDKLKLTDENYNITLPDGSVQNIGVDGRGGLRDWKYADKIVPNDERKGAADRKLNAYDIDYTNDLDYFAGMGGVSLARILTGSKETAIEQVGGQVGNAALGKVGFGAEMTPENFDVVMQNMRAIYAQSGIKSKDDAFSLAQKAYEEGRINDIELVQMQQSYNMVFDNDFNTATKLSAGRWKGINVAASAGRPPPQRTSDELIPEGAPTEQQMQTPLEGAGRVPVSKEEAIQRNRAAFQQEQAVM